MTERWNPLRSNLCVAIELVVLIHTLTHWHATFSVIVLGQILSG